MRTSPFCRRCFLSLLAVLSVASFLPVLAIPIDSPLTEQAIYKPPDFNLVRSEAFGSSVDIDGDTVVVGDFMYNLPESLDTGIAHVFVNNSGVWEHQALLVEPDAANNNWFGYSVSISGDTIAVSAPQADLPGSEDRGAVYIFERSGSSWIQTAKLTTLNGQSNDKIGISLSLQGDVLAVGAPYADIGGTYNQGVVYLYLKPASGWADMTETAQLTASDGVEGDWLGNSVALDGEWLIAGAPESSATGMYATGAVYVFKKPPSGWTTATESGKLTAPTQVNFEKFGYAVDLNGNILGVGCSTQTPTGVTVFRQSSGNWVYQTRLPIPGGVADMAFGRSIAVGYDQILVGSFAYDAGNPDTGHAYHYLWNGTGWVYDSTLTPSDGILDDRFGWSTASDGDKFVVGATNGGVYQQGQAYLFAPGPGVLVHPTSLELFEDGPSGTYTVKLQTQPAANVTISVAHESQLSVIPSMLTFTSQNWDIPQSVSVVAIQDDIKEGDHISTISHSSLSSDPDYQGLDISSVIVAIREGELFSLYLCTILGE